MMHGQKNIKLLVPSYSALPCKTVSTPVGCEALCIGHTQD
jgi:hypothetical protein